MENQCTQAVDVFCHRIASSLESDYGDWMREANLAFLQLSRAITHKARESEEIRSHLSALQDAIQFKPNGFPISTCRFALLIANDMRTELGEAKEFNLHEYGIGWTEHETPQIGVEFNSVGVRAP